MSLSLNGQAGRAFRDEESFESLCLSKYQLITLIFEEAEATFDQWQSLVQFSQSFESILRASRIIVMIL